MFVDVVVPNPDRLAAMDIGPVKAPPASVERLQLHGVTIVGPPVP